MTDLLLLGSLLLASQAVSTDLIPQKLSCKATGSWTCSDICIDSSRGKGDRISFNLKRMTFKSSAGNGRVVRAYVDERGKQALDLSDDRTFTYRWNEGGEGDEPRSMLQVTRERSLELICSP